MADIFISYAREDRERAGTIANVLESCGWSVWWDRMILTGQAFDEAIERELEAAKCVIVLWSQESAASELQSGRRSRVCRPPRKVVRKEIEMIPHTQMQLGGK